MNMSMRPIARWLWVGMFLGLCGLGLASCRPTAARQPLPQLAQTPTPVKLPAGYYGMASWVDDEHMVLSYSLTKPKVTSNQLLVVNLRTTETYEIPIIKPEGCKTYNLLRLRRLSRGETAYLQECYYRQPGRVFEDLIFLWDAATKTQRVLYHYPTSFGASTFTFAPDLSQGLQEQMGDGIFNQLYAVDSAGHLTQLFMDYYRVGVPDWAPDGAHVAFAGTPATPKARSSLFTGLVAIDNALAQPWKIYRAKPDLSEQAVLLENILGVRDLLWSPDSRWLAFNARSYQGWEGVFLLNLQSKVVTQIWSQDTEFEWSPDGQRMLIMVDDPADKDTQYKKPVILPLQALLDK